MYKELCRCVVELVTAGNSMQKPGSVRGGHCNVSEDTAVSTVDVAVSAVFCKILS